MPRRVEVPLERRAPGLTGLPELVVGGLTDADARSLLDSGLPAPLDIRVRDQIVAETRGNPLALLEVPRGLTPAELAGGFGLPARCRGPAGSRPYEATAKRLPGLIGDVELVPVEEGPHNIGWTHPDEVNSTLLDFLSS